MSGKLIEISRFDVKIQRVVNFHSEWWENSLCVRTDIGLQFFDLSCNLNGYEKSVDIATNLLPSCGTESIASIIRSAKIEASTDQCFEYHTNPAVWSYNESLARVQDMYTSFEWSPLSLGPYRSCLAVLTSHGCVCIYSRQIDSWHELFNITKEIDRLKSKRFAITDLNSLKEQCEMIQSSAVCWGSTIDTSDQIFVTAQRNLTIIIWKASYCFKKGKLRFTILSEISTDFGEINSLTWIMKDVGHSSLVFTSFTGIIKAFNIKTSNSEINFNNPQTLWMHSDLMVVKRVHWQLFQQYTILVCIKHRHLLVFLLDSDNVILHQYINNVNDHDINSLTVSGEHLYISTANQYIFKLNIRVVDDKLHVEYTNILLRDENLNQNIFGIAISENNAIMSMLTKRIPRLKKQKDFLTVTFLKFCDFNIIHTIITNPSEKLTRMWDCIELLRLQVLKDKSLPDSYIENLFSDPNLSTYYMKVFIVFTKIFQKITYIRNLPENSIFKTMFVETVKDTLLVKQAISTLNQLYEAHLVSGGLSEFKKKTVSSCFQYCEYYCNKYKFDISAHIDKNTIKFSQSQSILIPHCCMFCDQVLDGYKCNDGHPNQFCVLTLLPITDIEHLVCKVCHAVAKIELESERPLCTFCDIAMMKNV